MNERLSLSRQYAVSSLKTHLNRLMHPNTVGKFINVWKYPQQAEQPTFKEDRYPTGSNGRFRSRSGL